MQGTGGLQEEVRAAVAVPPRSPHRSLMLRSRVRITQDLRVERAPAAAEARIFKRPPGRAPKGKQWDIHHKWVPQAAAPTASASPATSASPGALATSASSATSASPGAESTGWREDDNEHIGKPTLRFFPGENDETRPRLAIGKITKFLPREGKGNPPLWHNVHDDAEEEDLDEMEVKKAIKAYAASQTTKKLEVGDIGWAKLLLPGYSGRGVQPWWPAKVTEFEDDNDRWISFYNPDNGKHALLEWCDWCAWDDKKPSAKLTDKTSNKRYQQAVAEAREEVAQRAAASSSAAAAGPTAGADSSSGGKQKASSSAAAPPAKKAKASAPAAAKGKGKATAPAAAPTPSTTNGKASAPRAVGSTFRRKAFVVGFNHYSLKKSGGVCKPLHSAVNDATAIAKLLRKSGIEVTTLVDKEDEQVTNKIFEEKLNAFTRSLARGDLALFFFAGHGVTYDNKNYLLPSGDDLADPLNYSTRAMSADRVLDQMQKGGAHGGSRFQVLILDCCREWVGLRGGARARSSSGAESGGLTEMTAPSGSVIAFATSPNSLACEVDGHGHFTRHLLKHICNPGVGILNALNKAGLGVMKDTREKQVPWTSSTPMEEWACLVPPRARPRFFVS